MRTLRLGTRKSLLAWAQSSWVAREIERLNPGIRIELQGIETRGDRILDVSLSSITGKEFFVQEIDDALRAGAVDLTVHSMKDLSLDRPPDFTLAAIPRRENPRDVILFGPGAEEKLRSGKSLKIGTSSPRRLENIPPFLRRVLPRREPGVPAFFELQEIRGNVNTRLSRVHRREDDPKALDGVVLAFAGLIRLWADIAGKEELQKLLEGVRWMVLPLSESPAAPAQGALAVECRADDDLVKKAVGRLHDEPGAARVARERALLAEWGGGCHQRFGATAVEHPELGALFFVRGAKPDGDFVERMDWQAPPPPAGARQTWDGSRWREARGGLEIAIPGEAGNRLSRVQGSPRNSGAVFVAHARAAEALPAGALSQARLWTSGVGSWEKLADLGYWVEGCTEGLGFQAGRATLTEPILQLPLFKEWRVLTHAQALEGWDADAPGASVVPSYRLPALSGQDAVTALEQADEIFWSSGSQWDELRHRAKPEAQHACGPGRTAARLRAAGVLVLVFPSVKEWRKWLKISD